METTNNGVKFTFKTIRHGAGGAARSGALRIWPQDKAAATDALTFPMHRRCDVIHLAAFTRPSLSPLTNTTYRRDATLRYLRLHVRNVTLLPPAPYK